MVDKYLGSYFRKQKQEQAIFNMGRSWGRTSTIYQILMLKRIWEKEQKILKKFKV